MLIFDTFKEAAATAVSAMGTTALCPDWFVVLEDGRVGLDFPDELGGNGATRCASSGTGISGAPGPTRERGIWHRL
ncbi:MAG: hypothetical protein U1E62_26570 [Alsobacter sp.]